MRKIYDLHLSYLFVRKYLLSTFKIYYKKITVTGYENIPKNSPIIFAPNHLNALMDSLAVALIASKKQSTSFLARSDVFNNKFFAKLLTFSKIMPAFRMRDGYENLGKNFDSFEMCKEILIKKQYLCIMPEGNQEIERNVRPLVKGLFRIAFAAQKETEDEIFIVPVGLDYEDLINFGKNLIINIGEPISVKALMNSYNENQAKAINEIKDKLKSALEELTVNINSKDNYEFLESIFEITTNIIILENHGYYTPEKVFELRKDTAKKIIDIENNKPETFEKLKSLYADYLTKNKKLNFSAEQFKYFYSNNTNLFVKISRLILLSPVFIAGFIFNFLAFLTPLFVRKIADVKFKGFFSSVYFAVGIVSFPVFYLLQSLIVTSLLGVSFWFVFLLIPAQYYLGRIAYYEWLQKYVEVKNQLKIQIFRKNNTTAYQNLKSIFDEILFIVKQK